MEKNLSKYIKTLIAAVVLLISILLSLDAWEVVLDHQYSFPLWYNVGLAILQTVFYAGLALALFYINVVRKEWSIAKNTIVSFIVLVLFVGAHSLAIDPAVEKVNKMIDEDTLIVDRYEGHRKGGKHYYKHYRHLHDDWEDWNLKTLVFFSLCMVGAWIYQISRQKSEMKENYEALQKEALQSRLSALTNQINPHFFFNSLNSLYSLVLNDEKTKSLEYITKMSGMFRYILQSEEKRLVQLTEEMNFLNTYSFMLAVKYDKKLQINRQEDHDFEQYSLPVLSLLPLIENVIKHNEISRLHPMVVDIYIDEQERLVVTNPKRERLDAMSVGTGLSNLNNRFELITGKEIKIEDSEETFTVRLPLIKTEKA